MDTCACWAQAGKVHASKVGPEVVEVLAVHELMAASAAAEPEKSADSCYSVQVVMAPHSVALPNLAV